MFKKVFLNKTQSNNKFNKFVKQIGDQTLDPLFRFLCVKIVLSWN